MTAVPFHEAFTHALRGTPVDVVGVHHTPTRLPTDRWSRPPDADDLAMIALCTGPTLDVGCGPGRMSAALASLGHDVLGIDVVPEAVEQTRRRGAPALRRDVFGRVPGEGRWRDALLVDGNVGIGGDPVALLSRIRSIVLPDGHLVVELAQPGIARRAVWAELVSERVRSKPFRWAILGVDDIDGVAAGAGLRVAAVHQFGDRWCAVLRRLQKESVLCP